LLLAAHQTFLYSLFCNPVQSAFCFVTPWSCHTMAVNDFLVIKS
jgi:hypothetical protein